MTWAPFVIALILTYLLQVAVLPLVGLDAVDALLVLALVCGLAMPATEARLAGWFTGFAQDLGSESPMGLHAFTLGLVVLALTYVREVVNQNLWWVRWLVAFIVAFPAQFLLQLHFRFLQNAGLTWSQMLGRAALTAVIASLLAALVLGLPAVFGRPARRRRAANRW